MIRRLYAFVAVLALAAAVVAGCDSEDPKRYDVTVRWNVAGAETCSAYLDADTILEFDQVEITVFKAEGDEEPIQDPIMIPCTDFTYTIPRLKRGNYFVELGAYAEDEDQDYLPYYQASGAIKAPDKGDGGFDFPLMLGKGDILVRWGFEDYGWCDTNGVTDMDISLAEELVPCIDESYPKDDVNWASYTLTITGLDADGEDVAYGEYNDGNPFMVKPGQLVDALVVLSPL